MTNTTKQFILTETDIEKIIKDPNAEAKLYREIRESNANQPNSIIAFKTIRVSSFFNSRIQEFWPNFLMGITETEQLKRGIIIELIRPALRVFLDKLMYPFKVDKRGVTDVKSSHIHTKEEKKGLSKKQSTTLGHLDQDPKKNFLPKLFGYDDDVTLVGIMYFSDDISNDPNILLDLVLHSDAGTVAKPNRFRFDSKELAENYAFKKIVQIYENGNITGNIFNNPQDLFQYGNVKLLNETLARIRLVRNNPKFQITVGNNELSSKILAQFRAMDCKANLDTNFFPISFYLPENNGEKIFEYTLAAQQQDLMQALHLNRPYIDVKTQAQAIEIYHAGLSSPKLAEITEAEVKNILSLISTNTLTSVTKDKILHKMLPLIANYASYNIKETLMLAAKNGCLTSLTQLLKNHENEINQAMLEEITIKATQYGHLNIIKELIKNFPLLLYSRNEEKLGILVYAAANGYLTIIQELCTNKDYFDLLKTQNDYDYEYQYKSALKEALTKPDEKIILELANFMLANIPQVSLESVVTMHDLYTLYFMNKLETFQNILKFNFSSEKLLEIIMFFLLTIDPENNKFHLFLKELLKYNFDINSQVSVSYKDRVQSTFLLFLALKTTDIESFKLLISHKDIQINITDEHNNTPLMLAVMSNEYEKTKALLSHHDIEINAVNDDGDTALMLAVQAGNFWMVKLLLEQKEIDIEKTNNSGKSALRIAYEKGYYYILPLIFKQKVLNLSYYKGFITVNFNSFKQQQTPTTSVEQAQSISHKHKGG